MDSRPPAPYPRIAVILVVVAAAVVALMGIQQTADLIAPLFLTVNLFIAAWPVRSFLVTRGAPRLLATVALSLVVFFVLGAFFFSLGWGVSALVAELPGYQEEFENLYGQMVSVLAGFGITQDDLLLQIRQLNPANFAGLATGALGRLSGMLSVIGVVVVMIFMMVIDSSTFPGRSRALETHQPLVAVAIIDFVGGVRRYWIVTSVFGLIVAVIDVAILLALGIPLALVWGIVSFLTNYIPNVGFLIGIIPPALMALLAKGPTDALIVVVGYSLVNLVIQSIIQPKFNGDAVGVTATVSFLSLLLWGAVLGPLGALLGLPATLLVKALLIDHDPHMRWVNAFIASDPATTHPDDAEVPKAEGAYRPMGWRRGSRRAPKQI